MVIGENRPFVTALIVPDEQALRQSWQREKKTHLPQHWRENKKVHQWLLERMQLDEADLASYMQVQCFAFVDEEWTQDNGLITPTMKIKRKKIMQRYSDIIESLYT